MKLFSLGIFMAVFAAVFVVQVDTTHARYGSIEDRLNRAYERLEARKASVEERVERAKSRVESRKQSVCERLSDRGAKHLPHFCEDVEPPEPELPTVSIDADPLTIELGGTSTLSWTSEDADSCEASDGWSGTKDTDGSMDVSPSETTTYTLTCSNEDGDENDSVIVTVEDVDPEVMTVYDVVVDDERLTTLETVVGLAELDDELDDESATWTLFAPTDAAFGLVPSEVLDELLANPTTTLADVLLYHLLGVEVLSGDLLPINVVTMVNGDTATVTVDASSTVKINDATVVEADIETDNGVVHVIDMVIVPPADEEPEPEPGLDHLVISEVLYDVLSPAQGAESENEWVEIYNPTDTTVDLMDWMIGESTSTADVISDTTLDLAPGDYLLITNSTTTADFWDLSLVDVVYLESAIGNGLANGGDHVGLFNAAGDTVDAVSYGSNTDAFDPSVPVVTEGNSIERDPVTTDTDTAADWSENVTPTPGA